MGTLWGWMALLVPAEAMSAPVAGRQSFGWLPTRGGVAPTRGGLVHVTESVGGACLPPQRNVTLITLDDFGDGSVALQNVKLLNSTYNAQLIAGINGNGPFEQILPFVVQNRSHHCRVGGCWLDGG